MFSLSREYFKTFHEQLQPVVLPLPDSCPSWQQVLDACMSLGPDQRPSAQELLVMLCDLEDKLQAELGPARVVSHVSCRGGRTARGGGGCC